MKKKLKKKSYDYGGNIDLSQYQNIDYIDNPAEIIAQDQINFAKAKAQVAKNPLIQGGKMLGKLATGIGSKMVSGGLSDMASAGKLGKVGGFLGKQSDTLLPLALQGLDMMAFGGKVNTMVSDNTKNPQLELNRKAIMSGKKSLPQEDSILENLFEIIDPTGYSSWDDVQRAYRNPNTTNGERQLEVVSALPLLGKLGKLSKLSNKAYKGLKALGATTKAVDTANKGESVYDVFAYGGNTSKVSVEVEGDEAFELPNGKAGMFKGPSHEEGGIDVDLPEGTDIFSDRISIDGKTMAERKAGRERKLKSFTKRLDKNSSDQILKNTVSRIEQSNSLQEEEDKQIQEMINMIKQGPRKKLAGGTGSKGLSSNMNLPDWMLNLENSPLSTNFDGSIEKGVFSNGKFVKPNPLSFVPQKWNPTTNAFENDLTPDLEDIEVNVNPETTNYANTVINPNADKISTQPNVLKSGLNQPDMGEATLGDLTGMSGNFFQAYAPYLETLNNRSTDQPNINPFKDFGKNTINTLEGEKGAVKQMRDNALSALELSRTAQTKRGRNMSRGINQQKASDLATLQIADKGQTDIYNNSLSQLLGISDRIANAQSQQDQMVMQGEQYRDLSDRQDKDIFSKEHTQDLRNLGNMISVQGDTFNKIKQRKATLKAASNENPNFYLDANGNVMSRSTGTLATPAERKEYHKQKAKKDEDGVPSYEEWANYTEDQKDYFRTIRGNRKK